MKVRRLILMASLLLTPAWPAATDERPPAEHYFAIEMNRTVCGYSKFTASPLLEDGKNMILLKHEMLMSVAALGSKSESRLYLTYHIDPASGRFTYHDSLIEQGEMRLSS